MIVYTHDQTGVTSVRSFVFYVRFLHLDVPSVRAVIFAEGVVGIRRVRHRRTCACIRTVDRYG